MFRAHEATLERTPDSVRGRALAEMAFRAARDGAGLAGTDQAMDTSARAWHV
jgi:hypothetical protein